MPTHHSSKIGLVEGLVLAEILKSNSRLTSLNLAGNEVDDEAAIAIAEAACVHNSVGARSSSST